MEIEKHLAELAQADPQARRTALENVPVSYTHLDVYKRQLQPSGFLYITGNYSLRTLKRMRT